MPDVSEEDMLQPPSAHVSAANTAHRLIPVMVLRSDCVTTPLSEHLPGLLRTGIPYPSSLVGAPWSLSGESTLAPGNLGGQHTYGEPKVNTLAPSPLARHDLAPRPALKILLTAPRGFCAGVDRAIKIVELALQKFGAPVYVRHEIVHNRHVVDTLKGKGAIFVEELSEIPETGAPVIFSAHGVPKSVPADAEARRLFYLDATCPLVSKVHAEARDHHANGLEIVLIGHAGHPEVIGTLGQLPPGTATLIETVQDASTFTPRDAERLAYITQTTLSVDDTAAIVAMLKERFPAILGPRKEDICYATTNRQEAVKAVAGRCDRLIVVGAPNSSNSLRLVEVAERAGCPKALLVQRAADIPWDQFEGIATLAVTAGASAPELLVTEIIDAFRTRFEVTLESVVTRQERIAFNVPRELREPGAASAD
jgi:4-hydroxy-3-methylbut-2-en-1-yl diphosphate reductase